MRQDLTHAESLFSVRYVVRVEVAKSTVRLQDGYNWSVQVRHLAACGHTTCGFEDSYYRFSSWREALDWADRVARLYGRLERLVRIRGVEYPVIGRSEADLDAAEKRLRSMLRVDATNTRTA